MVSCPRLTASRILYLDSVIRRRNHESFNRGVTPITMPTELTRFELKCECNMSKFNFFFMGSTIILIPHHIESLYAWTSTPVVNDGRMSFFYFSSSVVGMVTHKSQKPPHNCLRNYQALMLCSYCLLAEQYICLIPAVRDMPWKYVKLLVLFSQAFEKKSCAIFPVKFLCHSGRVDSANPVVWRFVTWATFGSCRWVNELGRARRRGTARE
jgi:hypothetical protein